MKQEEAKQTAPKSIFGYTFSNPALLQEALTTPAFRMSTPSAKDNQRLEFLGDAVLGLLAADYVYAENTSAAEGSLTVRRTHMVSTPALCDAATRHGLAPLLRRNKGAGELPSNSKTLADAVEAIVGAAWLDGGIDAARKVFNALELCANAESGRWSANPKGELQMRAQSMTPSRHPVYRLVDTAGVAHQPVFTVEVTVEGIGSATAKAGTHKEAEARAAAQLLASGAI
ncbi:MAG: ribonuclease III [Lentisphaerae bacterium]|jgi:ribonuclease-3|nr:ribonuclease III [Lentisphaerota bacterium]